MESDYDYWWLNQRILEEYSIISKYSLESNCKFRRDTLPKI